MTTNNPKEIHLASLEEQRDRLKGMLNAIKAGFYTGDEKNVENRINKLNNRIKKEQGNVE